MALLHFVSEVYYRADRNQLYQQWKSEAIASLQTARTLDEMTNAVGPFGLYIALTNGNWIAIRYRDRHSFPIVSCAVARDSGGAWFESDRHFCGSLKYWPQKKMRVEDDLELRRTNPELFTNTVPLVNESSSRLPTYREMHAIETAPDLGHARSALQKIGFVVLKK